ncbi:MAG: hypothetical protein P8O70_00190 [SAR324 cluster bacterium]|nr:hypothetical protein [SAR324 cluster bacterium]
MKKFKSLMLAALASAALAAPSFADGHAMSMGGEIVVGMKYTTVTPDGGDTTTVQDTYVGDVNAKLTSKVSDSASYAFEFLKDDEKAGKVSFEMTGTATSGDNSIKAFADLSDITGTTGYGDVYIQGSNKTLTVKVGKFGQTENYSNGLGYFRASDFGVGNIEHIVLSDLEGLGLGINAGDINITAEVPWMTKDATHAYALTKSDGTGKTTTNVSGIRPNIKMGFGDVKVSATFYSLSFSAQDGSDTEDKTDTAYQLQGQVAAGAAEVGLGYSSKTQKDGNVETTPNVLNGFVKVGLGGGQNVGASFEVLGDGAEADETKVTRISASYGMPFFVEAVTLKLGVGTSNANTDKANGGGSASGMEAEWSYAF